MIKQLDKLLTFILITLLVLMVLDVTWQILTRFFTDSPSSWTEELARFLLIWIGLLGAAWAFRQRAHLGLSYLVDMLSTKRQQSLVIFSYIASIIFAVSILIYGGSELVALTLELNQTSASLGWKIGYVYSVVPLSGILITIYSLDFIRKNLAGEIYIAPHVDSQQSENTQHNNGSK